MSWVCPLLAHGHGSVRPILQGLSGFIFILFSCPLHPFWSVIIEKEDQMGWQLKIYRLTVQGLWVDGSRFIGWRLKVYRLTAQMTGLMVPITRLTVQMRTLSIVQTSNRLSGSHLWRMARVVLWLVFVSNQSVASPSVHFSYKYQSLLFSFLHFQLKHIVKVQPSSLSDHPIHIVITTVNTFPPFA